MSDRRLPDDRSEGGAVLVLTALLLVVLMGMAALAVDAANAWSTKRLAQNNADMAALSAVVMIPHTWLRTNSPQISSGPQSSSSVVGQEVTRISGVNGCSPPSCTASSNLAMTVSEFELTVDVAATSNNAFAQAAGAGDSFSTPAAATARIQINRSRMGVLPLGFERATNRPLLRCVSTVPVPGSTSGCSTALDEMNVLAIRRVDQGCIDRIDTTIANFAQPLGLERLVDIHTTGLVRSDHSVCVDGHDLTMAVNASRRMTHSDAAPAFHQGLATGRLAGGATPLWEFLPAPPASLDCDRDVIAAEPEPFLQMEMMQFCLESRPVFTAAIDNERFSQLGWGFITNGRETYLGYAPVYINGFINAAGEHTSVPPAPGDLAGFSVFMLTEAQLANVPHLTEYDPGGIDNLDFELTD